jgi:hypothetical protein
MMAALTHPLMDSAITNSPFLLLSDYE